ncbi:uncharacterized protein LOC135846869 [Planococcus citri]|uniref:uncharacterized protein LOC135846869 n=1 Tax=Planococcus citri TaxID=170843 RepID=UPI0031F9B744
MAKTLTISNATDALELIDALIAAKDNGQIITRACYAKAIGNLSMVSYGLCSLPEFDPFSDCDDFLYEDPLRKDSNFKFRLKFNDSSGTLGNDTAILLQYMDDKTNVPMNEATYGVNENDIPIHLKCETTARSQVTHMQALISIKALSNKISVKAGRFYMKSQRGSKFSSRRSSTSSSSSHRSSTSSTSTESSCDNNALLERYLLEQSGDLGRS